METLKQIRHSLECKNIANLMYVLCMERRKCDVERTKIQNTYTKKINDLSETIASKDMEIMKITEEREAKQKLVELREQCVLAILKQFQKFINFALKATPTQAEFLLDIKKMMTFEFVKEILRRRSKPVGKLTGTVIPWKTTMEISNLGNLTPKDYHQCLNEVHPGGLYESDVIPAVYYKNRMYVREDFRKIFLSGAEVSETNLLWNRDVENLMKILKASVGDNKIKVKDNDDIEEKEEQEMRNIPASETLYVFRPISLVFFR